MGVLIAVGVISFSVELFFFHAEIRVTHFFLFAVFIYAGVLKNKEQSANKNHLAKRGLTEVDLNNVSSV
jgi:hypothetical protein